MEKVKKSPPRKKEFLKNIVKLRPCAVCEADSTGFHFGVFSCEACKVKIYFYSCIRYFLIFTSVVSIAVFTIESHYRHWKK